MYKRKNMYFLYFVNFLSLWEKETEKGPDLMNAGKN